MTTRIKWCSLLMILMILVFSIGQAFAHQIEPLSDSEFDIVTTNLKSTKKLHLVVLHMT